MKQRREPIIIGHRGSRGLEPENSLTAFAKALELGAGGLEMDLFITKDRQVVVTHDAHISHELCVRPQGRALKEQESEKLKIYGLNLEEIKPYDCGSKPHPLFPEQQNTETHIPLLSEVLEAACFHARVKHPLLFLLEIKSDPATDHINHPGPQEFAQSVLEVVANKNMLQQVVIISFDKRCLQEARKQNRDIRIGLSLDSAEQLQQELDRLGFVPQVLCPQFEHLTTELCEFASQHNVALIPWTVNEEEDLKNILALAPEGIITDYPDRALGLIEERKQSGK